MQLNILMLMADQFTASALSAAKAPNLETLASEGVVFENTYCASPLCAPSRFSLMTGCLPSRIEAWDNACELRAELPCLAHYLRREGYQTALAGKMHFCGPDQLHGFEDRLTTDIYPADFGWTPDWRHPDVRPDWYHNMLSVQQAGVCVRSNQIDYDEEVTHAARRHLFDVARSADERPFFLLASWTHPHDPYAALQRYLDRYREDEIPMPHVCAGDVPMDPHSARLRNVSDMEHQVITDDDVRRARHAYLANISFIDDQVGELLKVLKETDVLENTLIVFTSDHGDMLGERGLWYKMNWFEDASKVPFIVHGPKHFAPARVHTPVSGVDLLPTLVELARDGKIFEATTPIDGQSLMPQLLGTEDPSRTVVGEYCAEGAISPQLMIRRGPWKYIAAPGDPEQLYNLESDPKELKNLAAGSETQAVLHAFRTEAEAHWDSRQVHARVLESQGRRRLVGEALAQGRHHAWDFQPFRDASTSYMRNHLVLDDLEWRSRLPRVSGEER